MDCSSSKSGPSEPSGTGVTVVTYNLLSPELCTSKAYPKAPPECLDLEYRKRKIFESLLEDIKNGAILCLQEVSRNSMASELKVWLDNHGYNMIDAYYGSPWTGYMGEAIAYPRDKYTLDEMDVKNVAETMKRPYVRPSKWQTLSNLIVSWLFWMALMISTPFKLSSKVQDYKKKYYHDDYTEAIRRYNCVVMVRLVHKKSSEIFWVANYHMPCEYRNPGVMFLHAEHVMKYVQAKANCAPLIFAGDWNSQPDSLVYRLITRGSSISHIAPMKSAYREYFGKEPESTACSFTSYGDGLFRGTLDYIFVSSAWKVSEVSKIPDGTLICPNQDEPSDHVKISTVLYIPRSESDDSSDSSSDYSNESESDSGESE